VARINVLVAVTSPDVKAEVIAASVESRADMNLVEHRCVPVSQVDAVLESVPSPPQCALVLVGRPSDTNGLAQRWLAARADLVVMQVDLVDDVVRIALRDPRLNSLLTALRGLVERMGSRRRDRFARIQLPAVGVAESGDVSDQVPSGRSLLQACVDWVNNLLRDAVESTPDENGDVHGFSVTRATLLQSLDSLADRSPNTREREFGVTVDADDALDLALATADTNSEPLATAERTFQLTAFEFRLMILALSPELDLRFQRCIGFLLDDMSRRVGTMGLYNMLLGAARDEVANSNLSRWLVFEGFSGRPAAADEPLRLDPFLVQWLLGERSALASEPMVRRSMRTVPWPGVGLLKRREENVLAAELVAKLEASKQWIILSGDDPAMWRSLLELGTVKRQAALIRIEPSRLATADLVTIEECALRVGRMAQLTNEPLVIDVTSVNEGDSEDDALRLFLSTLGRTGSHAAVVCRDEARIVRLLGQAPYELGSGRALPARAYVAAVSEAAGGVGLHLTDDMAASIAARFPLQLDGLEHAMCLARSRPMDRNADNPALARFTSACKEVAASHISHLADRIEPAFDLDTVVLPIDRQQQLVEIVDNVRLAPRVLDDWKFREQLPYGRGVSALFFGPSGTGKTMAALGIAHRLGVQLLRIDLSRVVSKYIGDTEKNIDRVFSDAHRSGAAILIDEADALLGKRSEVKDAHDRYANIEVAYLLQRMEAYEGLAILTTNMRQSLDPAFLRRLRFIIDFPRPDQTARERIWRQCLPDGSHELDDASFRQLARRIDLTGGHIRQITLRAAFIAAAANAQIGLEHVAHAARAEFAKLGMPPVELDLSSSRRAA
jgi:SpoVK/Ycf46/Vps4 family AAA+-type ATPase